MIGRFINLYNDKMYKDVKENYYLYNPSCHRTKKLCLEGIYINDPPSDNLQKFAVFKEFFRIWAARKKEGNQEKNWHKATEEFGNYIKYLITNNLTTQEKGFIYRKV
jgi:hypothetical protein